MLVYYESNSVLVDIGGALLLFCFVSAIMSLYYYALFYASYYYNFIIIMPY